MHTNQQKYNIWIKTKFFHIYIFLNMTTVNSKYFYSSVTDKTCNKNCWNCWKSHSNVYNVGPEEHRKNLARTHNPLTVKLQHQTTDH